MKCRRWPEQQPHKAAADPEINEIERNEHTEGEQRSNRLGRLAFRLCAGPAGQHQSEECESGKPADNLPRFGELDAQEQADEQRREAYQDERRARFDSGGDRNRYCSISGHFAAYSSEIRPSPKVCCSHALLSRCATQISRLSLTPLVTLMAAALPCRQSNSLDRGVLICAV